MIPLWYTAGMSLKVNARDLPSRVVEGLSRGETIEIERDGVTIARASPVTAGAPQAKLWTALAELPPLDPDFERDIAELGRVVRPQPYPWE